jgi:hypothetical protein
MRLQPYACLAVWKALSAQAKAPPTNCHPPVTGAKSSTTTRTGSPDFSPTACRFTSAFCRNSFTFCGRQWEGGGAAVGGEGYTHSSMLREHARCMHCRICIRVEQRRGRRRLFVCTRTHLDVSKEEGSCSREGSGHTRGAVSGAGTSSGRQALLFSGAVRLLPPSCWL